MVDLSLLGTAAIVALFLAALVADRLRDDTLDSRVEQAKRDYERGDITFAEFERRVELEVDPTTERILQAVTPVEGIGPERGRAIARAFDSYEAFARANTEDLQRVNGIGPNRAHAIRDRLPEDPPVRAPNRE